MSTAPAGRPRYIRESELEQIVPYSHVHRYRLERAKKHPRRIKLSAGRVVWDLDEVLAWVAAKRAETAAE